jgi:pyruvate/oxaloacetate carboxyltransferase
MRGGPLDPKLDLAGLAGLAEYFQTVLEHYRPLLNLRSLQTDPTILIHQVPGGMLSNLLSQLEEQEALQRLPEVLEEIPRVRADLGYPPLVTPTSQIVGIQAVLNVLTGGRYRQITKEVEEYVKGGYGEPPGPVDPELAKRVLAGASPRAGRPADLLGPELAAARTELGALVPAADDAELLSYVLFPMVYKGFVSYRSKALSPAVLDAAALGIAAVLRAPAPAPAAPPAASAGSGGGGVTPWAHEGRVRLQAARRGRDAGPAHDRR